tara:strand:- start:207 stop:1055 length:849 start_codon:yes stop_codon:yes gene_type:complete
MIIFKSACRLQNHLAKLKEIDNKIGFIPTMGALHKGHISLIQKSVSENNYSVVSIFVNPTQFDNQHDLVSYPNNIENDIKLLDGISDNLILFNPDLDQIYNGKIISDVYNLGDLDKYMEGKFRKDHFQGVATVVHKLFDIVDSDNVYLGEKDFQQLRIIEELVLKSAFSLKIIRCKTIRDKNGLALSSRNKKLDISSQNIASNLFKALSFANENFNKKSIDKIYSEVESFFSVFPQIKVEYFLIADEENLKPVEVKKKEKKYRAFIAADISGVRLIDNLKLY